MGVAGLAGIKIDQPVSFPEIAGLTQGLHIAAMVGATPTEGNNVILADRLRDLTPGTAAAGTMGVPAAQLPKFLLTHLMLGVMGGPFIPETLGLGLPPALLCAARTVPRNQQGIPTLGTGVALRHWPPDRERQRWEPGTVPFPQRSGECSASE